MSWLSYEEIKIPHWKLTIGMFLMLLIGFVTAIILNL
jgi:hypothetical protein